MLPVESDAKQDLISWEAASGFVSQMGSGLDQMLLAEVCVWKVFFLLFFLAVVFFTHYMVGCPDLTLVWKFQRLAATPTTLFPSSLKWKEDFTTEKAEQDLLDRPTFASEYAVSFPKPVFTSPSLNPSSPLPNFCEFCIYIV